MQSLAHRSDPDRPGTPAQAACCPGPIDGLLDAELFRALGDPTRALLVGCLIKCGRGCTVGELAACCAVDTSVVSRHLTRLGQAGALTNERDGRVVRYRVSGVLSDRLRALADEIDRCVCDGARNAGGDCCGG